MACARTVFTRKQQDDQESELDQPWDQIASSRESFNNFVIHDLIDICKK
jgi:hypothetical protein